MEIRNCKFCGNEFKAKPSSKQKYCCKECFNKDPNKPTRKSNVEYVEVTCAECGKKELVAPCRAKKYVCCSLECLGKYNSKIHTKHVTCKCPICSKEFSVKPSRIKRVNTIICCSKECSNKLREQTYLGSKNHQYGLIGDKNSSFKGKEIISNYGYIFEYCSGHPKPCDKSNKGSRVRQHRLVIERNYKLFNPNFFEEIDGWVVLKDNYDVHHINGIKTDNRLENLQILTREEHSTLHQQMKNDIINKYNKIIGVLKQGELLENLEVDNQQPSLSSNTLEGSTTNNRVLKKDSNVDTSALLQQIINIVEDDIV